MKIDIYDLIRLINEVVDSIESNDLQEGYGIAYEDAVTIREMLLDVAAGRANVVVE